MYQPYSEIRAMYQPYSEVRAMYQPYSEIRAMYHLYIVIESANAGVIARREFASSLYCTDSVLLCMGTLSSQGTVNTIYN